MFQIFGTPQGGTTDDHSGISDNDGATDVTGAELEELTDGSETVKHSHAEGGTTDDHSAISANDGATDVTGAELEELTDGSETTKHSHATAGSGDVFVGRGNIASWDYTVGDFTHDTTWRDWDLSAKVPEAAAGKNVRLHIQYKDNAVGSTFILKEKGNANDVIIEQYTTQVSGELVTRDCEVILDANRVIQYYSTVGPTGLNVAVKGWWT